MLRLVILAVCVFGALGDQFRYDDYRVYEVSAKSWEDVEQIHSLEDSMGLDFWQEIGLNIPAHIMVSPQERQGLLDKLAELGVQHKVVVQNVQDQIDLVDAERAKIPRSARNVDVDYYSYSQNIDFLAQLEADNPSRMSVVSFGQSAQGRDLFYVKISGDSHSNPDPAASTKPSIWLEATTHAREWITNAMALNMIKWLVEDTWDSTVVEMLDRYDWFIVPVHNPDGYVHTANTRLWRKNRNGNGCSESSFSDRGNGVDTNRNWGFGWGSGTTDRCSATYQGPGALSEPANSYMADIMRKTPAHLRKAFFSLHSYSQLMLVPYAVSTSEIVWNEANQYRIANAAADAIYASSGETFVVGKPGHILYNAPGGAYDYAHATLEYEFALTYELHPRNYFGSPGFQLPPSKIRPTFTDYKASIVAIYKEMVDIDNGN